MIFTVAIQRAGLQSETEMYITEARTRMLGVARETVERVARLDLPFDEQTDPDRGAAGKTYPYVTDPAGLTSPGLFGGCSLTSKDHASTCLDLDDFHGITGLADSADGIPVELSFEVAYVDTLTGKESVNKTFAKRLTVTVSTPAVRFMDDQLSISYARVFAYPNTVDFARGVSSRL